ncbi:MAG TPA: AAA family ATPase, partial [Solirubrobacteraceae bacterium]|nr:AAA family ATPase [Solirubrobacteraceae bacterium]
IRGEAGIGKTRLASELRARALESGGVAVVGAALDLGGSAPLSLWAELVRELLPALAAPPPEASWPEDLALLTSELPAHFARAPGAGAAVAPDLQRTRLFEAVVALLCWAARERPLLLVLEDVHSADAPSLELAAYAARRLADLRVMLLATRRELPPSVDADRFEYALRSRGLLACELDLGPLAPEPLASLARTAARLSDIDVERVVASAEGNALLAVETARALGRGYSEVAPSLRGAARAALAPLAGDVRGLVEIAAVAARSLEPHEIAQLSLEDAEDAASQALLSGVLLSEEGRIGFRHALLREAVFEEIAEPRRRSLHKRWARALLASERAGAIARPAEVARQLRLAGSDADAAPQLARAAAEARALAALDAAVAYLEEALEIDAEKAELWLELGEVEAWRAERERAETAFERAAGLLSGAPPLARARAELRRARAYHGPICDPRGVLESTSAALELLEGSEVAAPDERSEALAARAWAEAVAGSVEEAERLLAELAADSLEHDDLRTYDLGHARALALMRRGRFVESYEPSIEAGEAIARAGRPDMAYGCWANAAGAATAAGDHARALEFLDRSTEAIAGQGLQGVEIHLIAARSFIMRRLGLLAEARAAAEAEQALAEQLGQADLLAMAMHDRGLVALAQEEFELAVALLGEALAADAPISRPLTRLALAEALARSKQPERAEEEVRSTVLEPVRASDFPEALVPRLARVQGLAALARGERAEAERRFAEAIAGWERLVARGHAGESITAVLADLGRPVVGVVEPEHELATVRAELDSIPTSTGKGRPNALVP